MLCPPDVSPACGQPWGQDVGTAEPACGLPFCATATKRVGLRKHGCGLWRNESRNNLKEFFGPLTFGAVVPAAYGEPMDEVEVRRSHRRKRTVSARRDGGRTIVMIPADMSKADEQQAVADLVAKLDAKAKRRSVGRLADEQLQQRAIELGDRYLPEAPRATSIRWVTNQNRRWGSCTPSTGEIRLSHRLQEMPEYVIDAVIVHELAHLLVSGHGSEFKKLIGRNPKLEQAMAFLAGVQWQHEQGS